MISPPFDHAIIFPHCGEEMEYHPLGRGKVLGNCRHDSEFSRRQAVKKYGEGYYECPRGCCFKWVSEIEAPPWAGEEAGEVQAS